MIEHLNGVRETVHFTENSSVRIFHNTVKEGYPLHWHNACEVIMPLRGPYTVACQNKIIQMSQGDILWIGAGVLHQIYLPETDDGERMLVLYDPRVFNEFPELSAVAVFSEPAVLVSRATEPQLRQRLQDILLDALQTEFERGYFKNIMIYADMMKINALIFSHLIAGQASRSKSEPGADKPQPTLWEAGHMSMIYHSCGYIRQHFAEPLTLEQVAEQTGFSKYYFSRLFKLYTQMSFLEFLNRCRISEAEKCLTDPEQTVTAAALACGFNSLSTFNRVFKQVKNCTPAEYQKVVHRAHEHPVIHGTEKYVNEFIRHC
ncbi:AraC family transcriptional regulator [Oscillospiraceae bacterium HV4-5-C5C]|nr:AraC family transcriptional regulator [Oscillospiraceae bacterium HV4-5-C5C]